MELVGRTIAELSMAVQAVFMDEISAVRALRYVFAEDGTLLLTLDCHVSADTKALTFGELQKELNALCPWQLQHPVMVGFSNAVVDVVTVYHAFEHAPSLEHTLMLISTPPDEYFESKAA